MADGGERSSRIAPAGVGSSGSSSVFTGAAAAGERPAGVALGHEALDADGPAGGQQVVGALGPQAVRQAKSRSKWRMSIEPARARELVHDHLGLARRDRPGHLVGIERIRDDGLRPQLAQQVALGARAGHAGHLVPARYQARDELPSQSAGGSSNHHLHDSLLS